MIFNCIKVLTVVVCLSCCSSASYASQTTEGKIAFTETLPSEIHKDNNLDGAIYDELNPQNELLPSTGEYNLSLTFLGVILIGVTGALNYIKRKKSKLY